ncbi:MULTISPECIES: hypothetical protein [Vibrio]|uniref:hypothetical protein n=1 Tax=Vibrio TaxID=662 RepID=UPI000C83666B|nr:MULTISPECIES: hypothetical protein [Vibrio]MDH5929535.1 hypothetical protein [Vibrio lentus]PMJ85471.1 hypothetical protein BCU14_09370 [Vibrio lentus]PMN39634.1 hypothetical protein BCT33_20830 [Vibrio lentus]PMN62579.1 hypothetical protein BCT29_15385 [Vibrio lentus]UQA54525.1 hypothetical protein ITG12_27575 [Vibrio sp. ED002]
MYLLPTTSHEAMDYLKKKRKSILTLINEKFELIESLNGIDKQAKLLSCISSKSKSILIHKGEVSNISLCLSNNEEKNIIQFPGITILFSVHQTFSIEKHTTNADNNMIVSSEILTISQNTPALIDGSKNAYSFLESSVLVGNLSFPKNSDINVFDSSTGEKKYWFTTDNAVLRALFTMTAMESLDSSHLLDVAKEYIYHYHPAVAWHAFRIIYEFKDKDINKYKSLILKSGNSRTQQLIKECL